MARTRLKDCLRIGSTLAAATAVMLFASRPAAAASTAHVPPTQEIEVIDPNADPAGLPAVNLEPHACYCDRLAVDIPPAVLVHRYYYTGDRSFQAQMLPGGPVIVVANHPLTNERCYIPVQMIPGAPLVRYTAHAIEYDFRQHGISVVFGRFGPPTVKYRSHVPIRRKTTNFVSGVGDHTRQFVEKSGLSKAGHAAAHGTWNLAVSIHTGVAHFGHNVLSTPAQFMRSTPIGSVFSDNSAEAARLARDRDVRAAATRSLADEASLPTLR